MEISQNRGGSIERALGWMAAACWLAAWALPVVRGYSGYAAFQAALSGPFRDVDPISGEKAVAEVLSALTNVAFLLMFLGWLRGRLRRPVLLLKLALLCLVLDSYWLVEALRAGEWRELLIGYYLWLAAFGLMVALGGVIAASDRRTSRTPTADTPA